MRKRLLPHFYIQIWFVSALRYFHSAITEEITEAVQEKKVVAPMMAVYTTQDAPLSNRKNRVFCPPLAKTVIIAINAPMMGNSSRVFFQLISNTNPSAEIIPNRPKPT